MKHLILLSLCSLAASVLGEQPPFVTLKDLHHQNTTGGRIINGQPAPEGTFQWQVAVSFVVNGEYFVCGGSILSTNWVLTAAHCAQGASNFRLSFGSTRFGGGVIRETTIAKIHSGYNPTTLFNDVALVYFQEPLVFNNNIQPIRLPLPSDSVGVYQNLVVSGWGKTADNQPTATYLNYVYVYSISNEECAKYFGNSVISSTLCCSGHNAGSTCSGDSGGPLVRQDSDGQWTLVGVVSFVHRNGCQQQIPFGFVRTQSMYNWVVNVINGGNP